MISYNMRFIAILPGTRTIVAVCANYYDFCVISNCDCDIIGGITVF